MPLVVAVRHKSKVTGVREKSCIRIRGAAPLMILPRTGCDRIQVHGHALHVFRAKPDPESALSGKGLGNIKKRLLIGYWLIGGKVDHLNISGKASWVAVSAGAVLALS